MTGTPVRLAAFAVLLAFAAGAAALAGAAIGPEPTTKPSAHGHAMNDMHDADAALPGLAVAQDGLRLVLDQPLLDRPGHRSLSFRILDAHGEPVRDFAIEHTKRLHLIVVRRDLTGFQHLHPTLDAGGRWTAAGVDFAAGGSYRVLADFVSDGHKLVLGADVEVPGDYAPQAIPASADTTLDDHGLTVRRRTEADGVVAFDVLRDGRVINDQLQDYLGAKGHLVTLRAGDLAYLHTHPEDDRLAFAVAPPSAGTYRSWVQFQLDGAVHTAAFSEQVQR